MSSLNGWEIAGLVVLAYVAVVVALYRTGRIGPDRQISLFGPALMLKTQRGRDFLDRAGRFRRFWTAAGDVGIVLAAIAMVVIVAVLILDAIVVLSTPASAALPPQYALGLPGINPIIPIGYGIVALVVGVVLHEMLHGVVARSQKIGVKSLGILWLVVPIGAFVEQDDEQMMKAPRRHRDRVAAAGVLANFALTIVFFVALSAVVSSSVQANANGVGILYVVPGMPAQNASLSAGDIITSINGSTTDTYASFQSVLSHSAAGQRIPITYYSHSRGALVATNVTLAPLSSYTGQAADAKKGFLGVAPTFLTPKQLQSNLVFPLSNPRGPLIGVIAWVGLPIIGLQPIEGASQSFYHLSGPLAGADPGTAWIGINLLYWLAWMNLLLGLSNALPVYPLDGGLLFRDFAATFASRLRRSWDEARLEAFAGRAVTASSIFVVLLLVWQFIGPRL